MRICELGLRTRRQMQRLLVIRTAFSHKSTPPNVIFLVLPGRQDTDIDFHNSFVNSPRRSQLQDVGVRTMGSGWT